MESARQTSRARGDKSDQIHPDPSGELNSATADLTDLCSAILALVIFLRHLQLHCKYTGGPGQCNTEL